MIWCVLNHMLITRGAGSQAGSTPGHQFSSHQRQPSNYWARCISVSARTVLWRSLATARDPGRHTDEVGAQFLRRSAASIGRICCARALHYSHVDRKSSPQAALAPHPGQDLASAHQLVPRSASNIGSISGQHGQGLRATSRVRLWCGRHAGRVDRYSYHPPPPGSQHPAALTTSCRCRRALRHLRGVQVPGGWRCIGIAAPRGCVPRLPGLLRAPAASDPGGLSPRRSRGCIRSGTSARRPSAQGW